jgi:hypothetical protein
MGGRDDGGDFLLSAYCCIFLWSPADFARQHRILVTTYTHVCRMARGASITA